MKRIVIIFNVMLVIIMASTTVCYGQEQSVIEEIQRKLKFSSHNEKVEYYNSDKDILKLQTTELLEEVLNYEMLVDIYSYDSVYDGIKAVSKQYTGLEELLSRKDLEKTLLNKYENMDMKYNTTESNSVAQIQNFIEDIKCGVTSEDDTENVYRETSNTFRTIVAVDFIESLIIRPEYVNQLNDSEKKDLVSTIDKQWEEKKNSNIFSEDRNEIYYASINLGTEEILDNSIAIKEATTQKTIYTPKGTPVTVICYSYWGDKKSEEVTAEFVKQYPRALLLANANNCYNCHSYAFVSASSHNVFWLNNPLPFLSDKSYVLVGNSPTAKEQKALWFENGINWEHSGIVDAYSGGVVRVVSKWGQGPLMKHSTTDCPYGSDTVKYYKKNY